MSAARLNGKAPASVRAFLTCCRPVSIALALGLILGLAPLSAHAAGTVEEMDWRIEGKLYGKFEPNSVKKPDFRTARDISGIACADGPFPRVCLIADDEAQGVQIVMAKRHGGEAGAFLPLSEERFAGTPLSLDAEGVAWSDGAFYVVGSHGRPRHETGADPAREEARTRATQKVFRIRLVPGSVNRSGDIRGPRPTVEVSSDLPALLRTLPEIAPSLDRKLADHGFNIEGVAVREGRMFLGLRAPVVEGKAAIVSVAVGALFDGKAERPELKTYDLGRDSLGQPRGVRDLTPYGAGLLVLAGPQLDPPQGRAVIYGDYAVYRTLPNGTAVLVTALPAYGPEAKPEALLPLEHEGGALRAVLLFDGLREGGGRQISFELR